MLNTKYKYKDWWENKMKIKLIILGLITGFISGFFGSGGGLILVPVLSKILLGDEVKSRATAIYIILFMVITSGIIYIKNNSVDLSITIKCIIGGIIGSMIGSKILVKCKNDVLVVIFIIFLFFSGIKIIVG